jgi:hypothetical protein
VGVDAAPEAERALEGHVTRRVVQVLLPAQHVGHAHRLVVDHHGEVVGGEAVALQDHEVVQVLLAELDLAEHRVAHPHRLLGHAEAHHVGLARHARSAAARSQPAGAPVAEGALLALGGRRSASSSSGVSKAG